MPPGGILSGSLSSSVFNFQEFYWYVFLKFKSKTDHGFGLLYIIEVIQPFEYISQMFVVPNHYFEQKGVIPGNVATFDNLGDRFQFLHYLSRSARILQDNTHIGKRFKPQDFRIEFHFYLIDNPRFTHFGNPLMYQGV